MLGGDTGKVSDFLSPPKTGRLRLQHATIHKIAEKTANDTQNVTSMMKTCRSSFSLNRRAVELKGSPPDGADVPASSELSAESLSDDGRGVVVVVGLVIIGVLNDDEPVVLAVPPFCVSGGSVVPEESTESHKQCPC